MLEHAVVHPMRHRIQLERLMPHSSRQAQKLTTLARENQGQPKIIPPDYFPHRDFMPTESGLTYWSSNRPSDSDVIRVVGLQGSDQRTGQ